jgi:hypothetical protein
MVFTLILTFSIITGFTQILSSLSDLKYPDPNKRGIGKITKAGWLFYVCAVILSVLPGIQKLAQDDVDEGQRKENAIAQDKRDSILRAGYDSSLVEMKRKFDTTTSIVSETLGKYGFKLDSTNKLLIDIKKDSSRAQESPVFGLMADEGIVIVDSGQSFYKLKITFRSQDAGSAYFSVKSSFVVMDKFGFFHYSPNPGGVPLIAFETRIPKNSVTYSFTTIDTPSNDISLFLWIRGTYKRIDGSGNYPIDKVYEFDFSGVRKVGWLRGPIKDKIIAFIRQNEK